jgi:hypothetical protein
MKLSTIAICVATLSVSACSTKNVSIDVDDTYSFAGKNTYAWLETVAERPDSGGETARRVRRSIDANLADRGFRLVPFEQADLVLSYRTSAADQRVYDTYGYGTGRWSAEESTTSKERVFTEGSLTIDIFDAAKKELIWRGTAVETIDPSASPQERDELVGKAVADLFDGFPPGN